MATAEPWQLGRAVDADAFVRLESVATRLDPYVTAKDGGVVLYVSVGTRPAVLYFEVHS